MRHDLHERRYLGGVRFVDVVDGSSIRLPLRVRSSSAQFFANRSGIYVIASARHLEDHVDAIEAPPSAPPTESVHVEGEVVDPTRRYLPRRFRIALPRSTAPAGDGVAPLHRPIDVALYPSPAARASENWTEIRTTIADGTGRRVGGALLRLVLDDGGAVVGRGMSDLEHDPLAPGALRATVGESVVFARGIPITQWGGPGDPIVVYDLAAHLEVLAPSTAPALPDPDVLDALPVPASNRFPVRVAAARVHPIASLTITLST